MFVHYFRDLHDAHAADRPQFLALTFLGRAECAQFRAFGFHFSSSFMLLFFGHVYNLLPV